MNASGLVQLLERYRFEATNEKALQLSVAEVLTSNGVAFEREVELTKKDFIDFLIGSLGLELKMKGSQNEVMRQMQRYAQSERVSELVLFTTRVQLCRMPPTLSGKTVSVACFPMGLL